MAEKLNDEQLQSISAQMQRRAERHEESSREYLQLGGRTNELLAEHENNFAQKLRDVVQGIGIALGEVDPIIELGPGSVAVFDANLPVGQVGEREFWQGFGARIESKRGPLYPRNLPDRPADAHITGGHEIRA